MRNRKKMKPVWVNGIEHKTTRDAIITTGGTQVNLRKSLAASSHIVDTRSPMPPHPRKSPPGKSTEADRF